MTKLVNQIEDPAIKEVFDEFIQNHYDKLNEDFPLIKVIRCICHCGEYEPMRVCFASKEIMVCIPALDSYNLTKEEIFACIAHEFGHLKSPLNGQIPGGINREKDADNYACKLGYKDEMISVISIFLERAKTDKSNKLYIQSLEQRLESLQAKETQSE